MVAAAVVLDPDKIPRGLNDSKKLDAETREALFAEIVKSAKIGVGIGDRVRIDRDNILAATMWAMAEAVQNLDEAPHYALVDGNRAPKLSCGVQTIVAGDARSVSIAAASIIAKVTRDRMMVALHDESSRLRLGQPTRAMARRSIYAALKSLGPCIHHRRSFAPDPPHLAGAINPDSIPEFEFTQT